MRHAGGHLRARYTDGGSNGIASTVTGITRFTQLLHGDIEYLFPDGS